MHSGQRPWTHRHRSRKNLNGFPKLFDIAFLLQNTETTFAAEEKARVCMGHFNLWSFLSSLEYPTWYMAWDERWPVIRARRDFVVESTMVALRPTRLRGIRLKLQDTFAFTQPTSVVMPVGNAGRNGRYRGIGANCDPFPDFHG